MSMWLGWMNLLHNCYGKIGWVENRRRWGNGDIRNRNRGLWISEAREWVKPVEEEEEAGLILQSGWKLVFNWTLQMRKFGGIGYAFFSFFFL